MRHERPAPDPAPRTLPPGGTAGFTLVELLVVALLGSLILMAIYQTLVIQEGSFRTQQALVSNQQGIRTALDVLTAELREVAADAEADEADSDIAAMGPDSIRFRAFRKAGLVCDTTSNSADVFQPGEIFSNGDSVLVFAENSLNSSDDDGWVAMRVTGTQGSTCGTLWPGYTRAQLTGLSFNGTGVRPGAPIRSFTWLTYGIYEVDGEWVLGRHENGGDIVALVGPLASRTAGGLRFQYYDVDGNVTAVPAEVVRIVITVKAEHDAGPQTTSGQVVDSLTTQLFLRNN